MNHLKRIAKTFALTVSMLGFSGGIALAQQCKVALVNMQQVITSSIEGKAASAKFDARVAELKVKVDVAEEELSATLLKLKQQDGNPNQSDITELNRAALRKKDELVFITNEVQKAVDRYRESLLAPIEKSAIRIAKEAAANHSLLHVVGTGR